jgi:hypothetical protein
MAYQGPGIQPARRMPSFASGYATYGGAEGADLWRGLTCAFAPFLGPSTNPLRMLFGSGIRPGGSSFSGGRVATSAWGWGWEFTSTAHNIVVCSANDAFPILDGSNAQMTAVLGYRKTDGTPRTTDYWRTPQAGGAGYGVGYQTITPGFQSRSGAGNDVFTPAAGYNTKDWHVLGARRPVFTTDQSLFLDGKGVASGSTNGASVFSGPLTIGSNAFSAGDLVIIGFFYLWNRKLSDQQVAQISFDPGILFRPAPRAVSRAPLPIIAPAPTLASLPVIEGGDIDCILDVGRSLSIATGLRNIGNALARRLVTPRGGLFYDPNYGLDVRAFVNAGFTPQQLAQVQGDVAAEVAKDERVENPVVIVVPNLAAATMVITVTCDLDEGPFAFIVNVNALTAELLDVQALS